MSLTASEQAAMDAFNLGIAAKQNQAAVYDDDDVLFFDDPLGKVKDKPSEGVATTQQQDDYQFDDIGDIYRKQNQYESTTNEPASDPRNSYQVVKQSEFDDLAFDVKVDASSKTEGNKGSSSQFPQISRDSGYLASTKQKKKASAPVFQLFLNDQTKLTKQDMRQGRVMGLINDEEDIGEVGEWLEHGANEKQADDDEFDVFDQPRREVQAKTSIEPWNKVQSEPAQGVEVQREKINKKLQQMRPQKRQGPIVNNLREKAKFMALANQPEQAQTQQSNRQIYESLETSVVEALHHFSDNEGESNDSHQEEEHESPNPKLFQLPANSIEKKLSSSRTLKEDEPEPQRKEIDLWEVVNKDRIRELETKPAAIEVKKIVFIDAWDQLKSDRNLRESVKTVQQLVYFQTIQLRQPGFFQKVFGCFSVHIKSSRLETEINQIIALSQTSYDDSSPLHFQIIYTIYCSFVNTDFCQRFGSHWESIGFQGRDPATDLRSTGVFGLLQLLAFVGNYKEYIKDCLEYSKQPTSSIPLCATLINITLFCLQGLKEQRFHSLINKEDSALSVTNKLYFAGWFFFFDKFKSSGGTFDKIGTVLQSIKTQIINNPSKLITEFNKAIQLYYKNREESEQ